MPDRLEISVAGERWDYWNDAEIHLSLDSHASVGFSTPFDAGRADFRKAFQPFSFTACTVNVSDELLFTGQIFDVKPKVDAKQRVCEISAYSLPAALELSDTPVESMPLEANKLTLQEIAAQVCRPFGVTVIADEPTGDRFERVNTRRKRLTTKAERDEKLGGFLAELARQRGFLLSSTPAGELRLLKVASKGHPVASLVEGEQPLLAVEAQFDPQNYFNEITGFTTGKMGAEIARYTERVQRLGGGALRSVQFKLDDVEKANPAASVKSKVGRMIANLATYTVHVPTWRDPSDRIWQPNTTILLKAPGAMIYDEYEFLIRDVYLKANKDEVTASLGLCLPGAFEGTPPERMPWNPL